MSRSSFASSILSSFGSDVSLINSDGELLPYRDGDRGGLLICIRRFMPLHQKHSIEY
jgi:hypothetical protein